MSTPSTPPYMKCDLTKGKFMIFSSNMRLFILAAISIS